MNPPDTLFEFLPHFFARNRAVILGGVALGALAIASAVFLHRRA